MRTKSILLGAAIIAAGIAPSMAQVSNVFSVNVVGYVNLTTLSNKFSLIQNPLDDGKGNIITNVLPLDDTWDLSGGTGIQSQIFAFSGGSLQLVEAYFQGFGWFPGTNSFPPGKGFYLLAATNGTLTFAGSVVTNSAKVLSSGFNLVGSSYPATSDITTLGLNGTNNVPTPGNPDVIYRYTPGVGLNDQTAFFVGYGWFETVNNNPVGGTGGPTNGPALNVGEAFFYQVATGNSNFNWNQNFIIQ